MYRTREVGVVTRALRVLDALRGFKQGRRVSELAAEVGSSERTVRRDIAELRDAGFKIIITKRENRSFACLKMERTASPIPVTKRQRRTLTTAHSIFEVLPGSSFLQDVRDVMDAVEQRMSDRERAERDTFAARFMYMPDHGTKSYAGKEDIVDALETGVTSCKVVAYRYADAQGRGRQGFMAPLGIAIYRNGLYVLGARMKQPEDAVDATTLRWFAIERFVEAEHLRAHTFQRPPGVELRDFIHGFGPHLPDPDGPHHVVIEFSQEKALLVGSRTWSPNQQIEARPDGGVRLTITVPSLAPLVSWIHEWGHHARVIAPPELVQVVADEVSRTNDLYLAEERVR